MSKADYQCCISCGCKIVYDAYGEDLGLTCPSCVSGTKAKAIEEFQMYFDIEYYGEELSQFIEQYAEKLRQQATDISTQV